MGRIWPFSAANYLDAPRGPNATAWDALGLGNYTLGLWLYLNGHVTTQQTLLSRYTTVGNLFRTSDTSPGHLSFFWVDQANNGHDAIGATLLSAGQWYHCAGTYNAPTRTGRVYLNGAQDGTAAAGTGIHTGGDTKWRLGLRAAGTFPADAVMAEVAMWDQTLSADVIAALAKGGSPFATDSRVIAYWPIFGSFDAGGPFVRKDVDVPTLQLTGALATGAHPPVMRLVA